MSHTLGASRVPASRQLRHLPAQLSLGQGGLRQRVLCLCTPDRFCGVLQCDPVDCGLPGFSVREGGSPCKNTGVYWPVLDAIPF